MADIDLEKEVAEILNEYDADVRRAVEKASKDNAKDCANYLKGHSPTRSGSYASGWAARKDGDGWVTYNSTKPSLTHLLNNDHVIRNKWGEWGTVKGDNHIGKAEEIYNELFLADVYTNIEKIGG